MHEENKEADCLPGKHVYGPLIYCPCTEYQSCYHLEVETTRFASNMVRKLCDRFFFPTEQTKACFISMTCVAANTFLANMTAFFIATCNTVNVAKNLNVPYKEEGGIN